MYRYAAPQRGRYREHWQLSVEAIGSDDPAVDAEVIQLYDELLGAARHDALRAAAQLDRRRELPSRLRRAADRLARRARRRARRRRAAEARDEPAARLRRQETSTCGGARGRAEDRRRRSATRAAQHFDEVRALPRRLRRRVHARRRRSCAGSTTTRARRSSSSDEAIGAQCVDLRRRPLRRAGRGSSAASRRRGSASAPGIERLLLSLEAAGVPPSADESTSSSCSTRRGPSRARSPLVQELRAPRARARRRLRGPLAQGPAHAGRAGSARRRSSSAGPSARPAPPRAAGRGGSDGRAGGEAALVNVARPACAASCARTTSGSGRRSPAGLRRAPRPRRARLHRPARRQRASPARDQSRARAGGGEVAHEIRNEFVLRAEGEVAARAPEAVNPNLPTGEVELQVDELEIVSRSEPLPFQLDEENVDETLRLRYRWLDLRAAEDAAQHAPRGARWSSIDPARRWTSTGFVDIWTPILTQADARGSARLPRAGRLQPGSFFALPQSPQTLQAAARSIAGFDRYYQIAICFRDEDLRADRQFEFRQLDLEMAFPDREECLDVLMERDGLRLASRRSAVRRPSVPFRRLTWRRGDAPLRLRQARPALRPRDPRRDRA